MADEPPKSFRDPYWSGLASSAERKFDLPAGLLVSLLTNGERSNADQVSEAGAKTVFQITPKTRELVLKRDGIDAYLSPENAAEVAALVAKDGVNWAKQRTQDSAEISRLAAGYYHGGGDTKNWGTRTVSYMDRVTKGVEPLRAEVLDNDFARWMQANPAVPAGKSSAAVPAAAASSQPSASTDRVDRMASDFGDFLKVSAHAPGTNDAIPLGDGETRSADAAAAAPGALDKAWAAGQAGLNTIATAIGGGAGSVYGGLEAFGENVGSLLAGQQPQMSIEQQAAKRAQQFTPELPQVMQTQLGREYTGNVGQFVAENAPAVAGLGGELALLARTMQPVVRAAGDATRAAPEMVRGGASTLVDRVRAAAPGAAPEQVLSTPAAGTVSGGQSAAAATAAPVTPMAGEALAQTAKKAADGGFGSKAAGAELATQAAPDAKTVAAAERLGIAEYLQPDHVTTSQAYRELSQAVKSIPGSLAHEAEIKGLDAVAARASRLIDEIGGTTDVSGLDASVKARMSTDVAKLSEQADQLYARVRQEIPLKAEAPANNVLAFIAQRADELDGVKNLTPLEKQIVAKLSPKTVTRNETIAADPDKVGLMLSQGPQQRVVETVRQPTYALLDDIRKDVGAAARKAGPFKDADTGLAKKLYSLIDDDQAAVVGTHGAGELFDAARKSVAVRKGIENDMQSLFGRALDQSIAGKLPGAVKASAQGNVAPLLKILQAVPDDMRQSVVASGVATSFRTAATRGEINFSTFSKWFDGLKANRQSYTAVMSNLPAPARRQLIDLYRVADGIGAATRERITTGRIQAIEAQFKVADSLATRLYEVARRGAVGAAAGTVATPILGPGVGAAVASALTKGAKSSSIKAVDTLITSPEFLSAVKSAGTPKQRATVKTLANSAPFRRFTHAANLSQTDLARQRFIELALQAAPLGAVSGPDVQSMRSAPRPAPARSAVLAR